MQNHSLHRGYFWRKKKAEEIAPFWRLYSHPGKERLDMCIWTIDIWNWKVWKMFKSKNQQGRVTSCLWWECRKESLMTLNLAKEMYLWVSVNNSLIMNCGSFKERNWWKIHYKWNWLLRWISIFFVLKNIAYPSFLINRNHVLLLMTNSIHCTELIKYEKYTKGSKICQYALNKNLQCRHMAV